MSQLSPPSPTKKAKSQKSSHHEPSEIQQIHLIQKQVLKRFVNPQQSNYCTCNICLANYQLKERGRAFLRQTSSSMKIQSRKTQQFLSLITAVNSKIYMKLDIPEVCFFFKGEAKKLFKSNNSGVHQVPITSDVRKHLIHVFLDNRKSVTNKNLDSTLSLFANEQRDTHIKNFSAVVPSFKYGQHIQTKKPVSFIFHNNKFTDDPVVGLQKSQSEQICIMKTRDKGLELINQKQLRQTFKSLLYLQNVDFIQSYIKPNEKEDQIYQATYNKIKGAQNSLMFSRSLTQIKTQINLINKFSKDYIPIETLENYESILKDIPYQYCLYQTYKMVHYMQLTKDVTIERLGTFWLKNQAEELCYFGLSDFQWRENEKFSVDVGQIQQLKQILNSSLSDFQQELLNAWQHMKSRKLKINQKAQVDRQKELQFEQIKRESLERLSKQKEQSMIMKRSKNKSYLEKTMDKNHM